VEKTKRGRNVGMRVRILNSERGVAAVYTRSQTRVEYLSKLREKENNEDGQEAHRDSKFCQHPAEINRQP
jgi:hypothetical protein